MRLIDHLTLGLRVIKKKKKRRLIPIDDVDAEGDGGASRDGANVRTTTSQKCEAVPRRARI